MQVATIPVTSTDIPTAKVSNEKDTELQKYLYSIHWEASECTNAKLEMMLAASCLRLLAGLTDIDFVVGLSREIHRKYRETMKLSLWYSTEILNDVSEKLRNKSILPTDTDTINELVNDAQEVITKRRYLSASSS